MEPVNAAIIYHSATGTVYALAQAAAEGAEKAGAEVRLRKVRELAPTSAIDRNPAWGQHLRETTDVPEAALDDLTWADVVISEHPPGSGPRPVSLRRSSTPPGRCGRRAGSPTRCIRLLPRPAPHTVARRPPCSP